MNPSGIIGKPRYDRMLQKRALLEEAMYQVICFEVSPDGERSTLDIMRKRTEAEIDNVIREVYGVIPPLEGQDLTFSSEYFDFNPESLKILREDKAYAWPSQQPGGRPPQNWFHSVSKEDQIAKSLPNHPISRQSILDAVALNVPTIEIVIQALAWGGMNVRFGKALFEHSDRSWVQSCEDIRRGNLSRRDAYSTFAEARAEDRLPGMGPAYFTKLIYFLLPGSHGPAVIMDQWSGGAVNVLTEENIVLMNASYTWSVTRRGRLRHGSAFSVSDCNTAGNYERFCNAVEQVRTELSSCDAGEAEAALFSRGGHNPGLWRRHVIERRKP